MWVLAGTIDLLGNLLIDPVHIFVCLFVFFGMGYFLLAITSR